MLQPSGGSFCGYGTLPLLPEAMSSWKPEQWLWCQFVLQYRKFSLKNEIAFDIYHNTWKLSDEFASVVFQFKT